MFDGDDAVASDHDIADDDHDHDACTKEEDMEEEEVKALPHSNDGEVLRRAHSIIDHGHHSHTVHSQISSGPGRKRKVVIGLCHTMIISAEIKHLIKLLSYIAQYSVVHVMVIARGYCSY